MIWYSSSMPMVRDGAFIAALLRVRWLPEWYVIRLSSLLHHVRRHRRTAARGDVEEGVGRDPGQAAVHVGAVEHERRSVEHPVGHVRPPVHERRVGLRR